MEREKFEEIKKKLEIEDEKWYILSEIESIILDNGVGIYPNFLHIRFLFSGNELYIKHGESKQYGSRLGFRFMLGGNNMNITFPNEAVVSGISNFSDFRLPQKGDILRATIGKKVLSESLISEIFRSFNGFVIKLANPFVFKNETRFSFYDPKEYDKETCVHGTEMEGIYTKFKENPKGKTKKFGSFHDVIKIKNIKEINLKLKNDKTFKLE